MAGAGDPNAVRIAKEPEGGIYPYRKSVQLSEAFEIFTRHVPEDKRSISALRAAAAARPKPFFVLLYGPPGSGKSYTFANLSDIIEGVNAGDAVSISLDALAESVKPFRNKSLSLFQESRGNAKKLKEVENAYRSTIMGKYNNEFAASSKNKAAKEKPTYKSLNEVRGEALNSAIEKRLNIIYERTVSTASKDILQDEIFAKVKGIYTVYVIYPQVDVLKLQNRLRSRVQSMSATGFARYVDPEQAEAFLGTHETYMATFLQPKLLTDDIEAIYRVFPDTGEVIVERKGVELPPLAEAAPGAAGSGKKKKGVKSGGTRKRRTHS